MKNAFQGFEVRCMRHHQGPALAPFLPFMFYYVRIVRGTHGSACRVYCNQDGGDDDFTYILTRET